MRRGDTRDDFNKRAMSNYLISNDLHKWEAEAPFVSAAIPAISAKSFSLVECAPVAGDDVRRCAGSRTSRPALAVRDR
jgi:hypothetical protein